MRKRLIPALAIVAAVIVVALAAWFGIKHFQSDSPPKQAAPKLTAAQKEAPHTEIFGNKVVVLINESSFGPKAISIKADSAVVWTNVETTSHQVVTDDGTTITATNSPVLAQGKSFEFTFTRVGTYKYHDNLHPDMQGTITVQ